MEKSPRAEIVRLGDELEQMRVALEDAHTEVAAQTLECTKLRRQIALQQKALALSERELARARNVTAHVTELASAMGRSRALTEDVELRNALEESSMLAEELQEANAALLAANEALDQRVAERTEALDEANRKLEALNAELSRRIEAETAARTRVQAELFQIQKLDAIGQLTGGIAHDFNNLLGVIISGLELLTKMPPEKHERVLRRTEEAAWRGAQLTQRLLTFARRQVLTPGRVDLREHMDNLRELFAHGLRENIKVQTCVESDCWPVEADIAALELALLNLAVNARDAMPEGGRLRLSARNRKLAESEAQSMGRPAGEYVELAVSDTGVGMAPEVVQKAFEPFFTTKGDKGTGLGLAQVYGFAKQSGGAAWVESTQGRGTVVRLLLPRSTRPIATQPEAQRTPPPVRQGERLNVLVVEDDDDLAASVVDMLSQLGHSGTRVMTMAAALAVLTGGGSVDLVFSDVLLPGGGSGLDLAREMARRSTRVPVILTSGYGGGLTSRLAAANLPFLRKPYRLDTLRHAIDTALPMGAGGPEIVPLASSGD